MQLKQFKKVPVSLMIQNIMCIPTSFAFHCLTFIGLAICFKTLTLVSLIFFHIQSHEIVGNLT